MKRGDLVIYKGTAHFIDHELFSASEFDFWIVLNVTNQKKSWDRDIHLFDGKDIITVPWGNREAFEVISEAD